MMRAMDPPDGLLAIVITVCHTPLPMVSRISSTVQTIQGIVRPGEFFLRSTYTLSEMISYITRSNG
jgi:hypothetical protein